MATEWTTFFTKSKAPENYEESLECMKTFIVKNRRDGNKIVLVSSGGTTVPLESRTVRFIDNFSVGTRGSASTEYFLRQGYAVLFLHRRGSLEPFKRHFSQANFLDMLQLTDGGESVQVKADHMGRLQKVLAAYTEVQSSGRLLTIHFTTLSDYLFLLKGAAQTLEENAQHSMFYLAAAVSDFYIPAEQMPEHKIQSSDGPLAISLQMVPKMLQPLVSIWAPHAYVVSFKLETDAALLSQKARSALHKYQHQVVIGNLLDTRKRRVVLVTSDTEQPIIMSDDEMTNGAEIEEKIVAALVKTHEQFLSS